MPKWEAIMLYCTKCKSICEDSTQTCPNCKRAAEHLDKAGIPYRKIICEENEEEAVRYGVRLAPTLIVVREGTFDKYANASNIIKYIEEATVKA